MSSRSVPLWEKTIRDGKVAVVISHSYGAGWSTGYYNYDDNDINLKNFFIYGTPEFIKMIETDSYESALSFCVKLNLPKTVLLDNIDLLSIKWVPVGAKFRIVEYDGAESVELLEEIEWETA